MYVGPACTSIFRIFRYGYMEVHESCLSNIINIFVLVVISTVPQALPTVHCAQFPRADLGFHNGRVLAIGVREAGTCM